MSFLRGEVFHKLNGCFELLFVAGLGKALADTDVVYGNIEELPFGGVSKIRNTSDFVFAGLYAFNKIRKTACRKGHSSPAVNQIQIVGDVVVFGFLISDIECTHVNKLLKPVYGFAEAFFK